MAGLFDALGEPDRSAVLSDCGRYRYLLTRTWREDLPTVTFVMLNPSKADAEQDDNTIRRCVRFARACGYGRLKVVNLFAYRSTDPSELAKASDPIGPDNDRYIREHAASGLVIAAWGAEPFAAARARRVVDLLDGAGACLHCLAVTQSGAPGHPLFIPGDRRPVPFAPSWRKGV